MQLSSKTMKAATLGLGTILMMGAGQAAFAHTTITNAITSGATGYTSVQISHGCHYPDPLDSTKTIDHPIVQESVVWPVNGNISVTNTVGGLANTTSGITKLSDFTDKLTLANLAQLIQNRDAFSSQVEQFDSAIGGSTIGWVSSRGAVGVNLNALIPFRYNAINLLGTTAATPAAGCVSTLKINAAVADICDIKSFSGPTPVVPGVNLWLNLSAGNNKLTDFYGLGLAKAADNTVNPPIPAVPGIEADAGSATLTINRDPLKNPYPANCNTGTNPGTDPLLTVLIEPSQIDAAKLIFPGWGPLPAGDEARFR